MNKDAGRFYDLRRRLQGQLAHHHWKLGKPFTPSQEEAWLLLAEVERLAKLLRQVERGLTPGNNSEFAYQVRHAVLMHFPAWEEGGPDKG